MFDSKTEERIFNKLSGKSQQLISNDGQKSGDSSRITQEWKPKPLPYHVQHLYNPDLALSHPSGSGTTFVEIKGYFQDAAEAAKYTWVKKCLKDGDELVFVFEKPDKAMHWLKVRKDGTKQTMAEWATKNGFKYYSEEEFVESFQ